MGHEKTNNVLSLVKLLLRPSYNLKFIFPGTILNSYFRENQQKRYFYSPTISVREFKNHIEINMMMERCEWEQTLL